MRTVKLGEVCEIVSGATPRTGVPEYWDGDVPWVTPADLRNLDGAYIAETPRMITDVGLRSCASTLLPVGSVLLSSRAPIGYVAINDVPMATNQGFKSLVPDSQVDAKYVCYWLRGNTSYLQSLGNGATFKELSKSTVERIRIPVPPLHEQRRIAAILDQADAIRAKRRRMLDQLDGLTQSMFRDRFESGGYSRVRIGAFAEVKSGSTPSRKVAENYGGGIPWVKTGEVSGKITETSESVSQLGVRSARLRIFPVGSIIIAMYGQGATRGRSALLGVEATVNQACAVIVPNGFFDSTFMGVQLKLNYDRLRNYAEGGSQPNLSLDRVAKFEVYNPPIDFQREFAYYVKGITWIRGRVERALAADDEQFASLQYRAFRGEL